MNLLQYILYRPKWKKLPPRINQFSTDFDVRAIDDVTAELMKMTHIRSPHAVQLLLKKHRAESPRELLDRLQPRRHRRNIISRAVNLYRRAFGLHSYNPMQSIARQHMRKGRS